MDSQYIRQSLFYTTSIYTANFIAIIVGIFVKRILGPTTVGTDAFILVIYSYANYIYGIIRFALLREVPALNAQRKNREIENLLNTSFSLIVIFTLISSMVFGVLFLIYDEKVLRFGLCTYVVINIFISLSAFYGTYLSSRKEFIRISKINFYGTIAKITVLFILTYYFSFKGYFLGVLLGNLIIYIFYIRNTDYKFRINIDLESVKKIFIIGLPLAVYGFIFLTFQNLDKIIIKINFPIADLGYYNIAFMFFTMMSMLPESIYSVYFPRFIEHINSNTSMFVENKINEFVNAIRTLMPMTIGIAMVISTALISYLLPAFSKGIMPTKILLLGIYFYSMFYMYHYYLVGISSFDFILYSIIPIPIIAFIVNLIVVNAGYGITGIACVTVLSYLFYSSLVMYLGQKKISYKTSKYLDTIAVNIFYFLPLLSIFIMDRYFVTGPVWRRTLVELLLFAAVNTPFMYSSNKKSHALGKIFQAIKPVRKA